MKFEIHGATDPGRKRRENEDAYCICEDIGFCMVADGMGGHAAGEVASATAVQVAQDFIRRRAIDKDLPWPCGFIKNITKAENILVTSLQLANQKVCALSRQNPDYFGMGTTVAALYWHQNEAALAHIGDSRVYRIQDNVIEQLTFDHSWVNEQLKNKLITEEEAKKHRWRNVITRALGNKDEVEIDTHTEKIQPGDMFVLCTDGLSSMVNDDRLLSIAMDNKTNPEKTCTQLVKEANKNGGLDNITVILMRCVS